MWWIITSVAVVARRWGNSFAQAAVLGGCFLFELFGDCFVASVSIWRRRFDRGAEERCPSAQREAAYSTSGSSQ
jgi:hypothetical protein